MTSILAFFNMQIIEQHPVLLAAVFSLVLEIEHDYPIDQLTCQFRYG